MTGIKKIVVELGTVFHYICVLQNKGYNNISIFFSSHPRHKKAGLLPDKILIHACKFNPRSDRHGKKVGEK
jgi:hypothetical protein